MFDSEITGIGAEIEPDCHARPCKGKKGLEVSDFSPDLLQFVDCWTAAVVATEGGDGAVEEGDEGDHQVEEEGGGVLSHAHLQLDGLHVLLVLVSPGSELSLPETQTLLQQQSWNIKLLISSGSPSPEPGTRRE